MNKIITFAAGCGDVCMQGLDDHEVIAMFHYVEDIHIRRYRKGETYMSISSKYEPFMTSSINIKNNDKVIIDYGEVVIKFEGSELEKLFPEAVETKFDDLLDEIWEDFKERK